jgi:uncharacterized membrane protein (UPF0127 family)
MHPMRCYLALLLPLLLIAACQSEAPTEEPDFAEEPGTGSGAVPGGCQDRPGITYRTDAQLQFTRADGSPIEEIAVEIAETDSTVERGLMDRRCLPEDWGMLFIFPFAEQKTFYMANTPRSLDIMFFGPDSALLNVAKYTEPLSPDVLPSEGAARFVVETPAGFADRYGLIPGDRISWSRGAAPADSLRPPS